MASPRASARLPGPTLHAGTMSALPMRLPSGSISRMTFPAPLPFRIKIPDEESIDFGTIRDVTTRVEGLLHLEGDQLVLEWAVTRTIEEVGMAGIKDETEAFAPEEAELPLARLAEVSLAGGILSPRLVLRGRSLRAFDAIPGAKGAALALHYRRADRLLAVAMLRAIEDALRLDSLPAE